jgi:hypothetical protein
MIGRFLCRYGLHSWRNHTPEHRHWSLECKRCGVRELQFHANTGMGYQPIDQDWVDGVTRPVGSPPNQGSGARRPSTAT